MRVIFANAFSGAAMRQQTATPRRRSSATEASVASAAARFVAYAAPAIPQSRKKGGSRTQLSSAAANAMPSAGRVWPTRKKGMTPQGTTVSSGSLGLKAEMPDAPRLLDTPARPSASAAAKRPRAASRCDCPAVASECPALARRPTPLSRTHALEARRCRRRRGERQEATDDGCAQVCDAAGAHVRVRDAHFVKVPGVAVGARPRNGGERGERGGRQRRRVPQTLRHGVRHAGPVARAFSFGGQCVHPDPRELAGDVDEPDSE
mmetsp:Transcript_26402/g.88778  ORF Transcript_26402/g.88778 Transcript_26402/m.88778 type:complete len:263 (-) Transcript_26402:480-1268(-)